MAVGVLEAFFYRNSRFFPIFRIRPGDAAPVRLWVVKVGFYNIVFGVPCLVGVVLLNVADADVGRTLVYMVCLSHVVLGIVLAVSEPKLWRNAVGQTVLPLLVVIGAAL